jgi:16S rRNA processing protein RimM
MSTSSSSTEHGGGMTDRLEVGRITKPHGLRGEVVVALTTNREERVAVGSALYVGDRELEVLGSRPHQGKWIVQFAGVEGREAADALHGVTLTAEALDDRDELWVHELIGAEVVETDGTSRGRVESVQANPASDLLVLESGALVPLVFVVENRHGVVVIDPPEGLFDAQT